MANEDDFLFFTRAATVRSPSEFALLCQEKCRGDPCFIDSIARFTWVQGNIDFFSRDLCLRRRTLEDVAEEASRQLRSVLSCSQASFWIVVYDEKGRPYVTPYAWVGEQKPFRIPLEKAERGILPRIAWEVVVLGQAFESSEKILKYLIVNDWMEDERVDPEKERKFADPEGHFNGLVAYSKDPRSPDKVLFVEPLNKTVDGMRADFTLADYFLAQKYAALFRDIYLCKETALTSTQQH